MNKLDLDYSSFSDMGIFLFCTASSLCYWILLICLLSADALIPQLTLPQPFLSRAAKLHILSVRLQVFLIILSIDHAITSSVSSYMDPPMDTSSLWRHLKMKEIINVFPFPTFSYKEKRSRRLLEEAVIRLPPDQRALLDQAAIRIIYSLRTSDLATNTSSVESVLPPILNDLNANFFETVSEEC